jgi:hypothetical protein
MPITPEDVNRLLALNVNYLKKTDFEAQMQHAIDIVGHVTTEKNELLCEVKRLNDKCDRLSNNDNAQYEATIEAMEAAIHF